MQIQTFYNGLNDTIQNNIDAAACGALIEKNCDEAYELLEIMANNNYQWAIARNSQLETYEVSQNDVMVALVEQVVALTKKMDSFGSQLMQKDALTCDICVKNHLREHCAIKVESVQYIRGIEKQGNYTLNNEDQG